MERTILIRRLPKPYADALRFHDRGLDDAMAERLGIEPEAVQPLIALAEAKLARLQAADSEERARPDEGAMRKFGMDAERAMRRRLGEHGFTGIELSVVVSFIAVLIGVLVPAVQTVRNTANRPDPCATPAPQVETEDVEFAGELTTLAVAHPNTETFRYKLGAGKDVVGVGSKTGNEWHLFGSASGLGRLAEPVQVVNGFHLVGSSAAIRGTVLPVRLRVFFLFDKDFTLLDLSILEAAIVDPCA